MTIHQAKDYGRLVAQCHGFLSEAQLRAHCWEHAYFLDYSLRKSDYVEGLLSHPNWAVVQERLDRALLPAVSS